MCCLGFGCPIEEFELLDWEWSEFAGDRKGDPDRDRRREPVDRFACEAFATVSVRLGVSTLLVTNLV